MSPFSLWTILLPDGKRTGSGDVSRKMERAVDPVAGGEGQVPGTFPENVRNLLSAKTEEPDWHRN